MFKMVKPPVILFFINGSNPTEENFKTAMASGMSVKFRNGLNVPESGALEKCDGVGGDVPPRYAETFPPADAVMKAYFEAMGSSAAAVNFEPAVKKATKPTGKKVINPGPVPAWKPNA